MSSRRRDRIRRQLAIIREYYTLAW